MLQTLQTASIMIYKRQTERERETKIFEQMLNYIFYPQHNLNMSQKRFPNILQTVSTPYERNVAIETIERPTSSQKFVDGVGKGKVHHRTRHEGP